MISGRCIRRTLTGTGKRVASRCLSWLPPRGVRVLGYHSIAETRSPLCVSPAEFERQLRTLRSRYFRTLSVQECAEAVKERRKISGAVWLTFDDGYGDFLETAAPLLQRYDCRATVFVSPEMVGRTPDWLHRDQDLIERMIASVPFSAAEREDVLQTKALFLNKPLMDWDQLRQLKSFGIDVQSHSLSHHFLTRLSPDCLAADLTESKRRIEQELGMPVIALSYPYGDCDASVSRAANRAGYDLAVQSTPWPQEPPFRIGRTQIGGGSMHDTFDYALSAALPVEAAIRRLARRAVPTESHHDGNRTCECRPE